MARRNRRRRHKPKKGKRFTTETSTYDGEVKTGIYVMVKNKNTPHNNLIFTEKDKLGEFIRMLKRLREKL